MKPVLQVLDCSFGSCQQGSLKQTTALRAVEKQVDALSLLGWLVLVGGTIDSAEFCLDTVRRSHSPSEDLREVGVLSELTP